MHGPSRAVITSLNPVLYGAQFTGVAPIHRVLVHQRMVCTKNIVQGDVVITRGRDHLLDCACGGDHRDGALVGLDSGQSACVVVDVGLDVLNLRGRDGFSPDQKLCQRLESLA